jgi:hypothetical protein
MLLLIDPQSSIQLPIDAQQSISPDSWDAYTSQDPGKFDLAQSPVECLSRFILLDSSAFW